LAKYYGLQPGEMEEMPVRLFNEYLKQIPAVERVFKGVGGEEPRMNRDEHGENVRDILRRHGVAVPEW